MYREKKKQFFFVASFATVFSSSGPGYAIHVFRARYTSPYEDNYRVVSFDPSKVSRRQIRAHLKAGGTSHFENVPHD